MRILSVLNLCLTIALIFSESNLLSDLGDSTIVLNCIFCFLIGIEGILCWMCAKNVSKNGYDEQTLYDIEGMYGMPQVWNVLTVFFSFFFLVVSVVLYASEVNTLGWGNILIYRVARLLRLIVITRFIWLFPALYEMIESIGKTFLFLRWVLAILITVCILVGEFFSTWLSTMRAYNNDPLEVEITDASPSGDILWLSFSTLYKSFQATFALLLSDNFGDMVTYFDDIAPGMSVFIYIFTLFMSIGLIQVVTAAFCGQFDDNKDSMRQMAEDRRKHQFEELWNSLVSFKTAAAQKTDCLDGIAMLQAGADHIDLEVDYSELSLKKWTVVVFTSKTGTASLTPITLEEKAAMMAESSRLGSGLYTNEIHVSDRSFFDKLFFWIAAVSEWIVDVFSFRIVPLYRKRHAFAHCILLERDDPMYPRYHFDAEKVAINDAGTLPITTVGDDGVIEFLRDSPLVEFCGAESDLALSKDILSEYNEGTQTIPLLWIKHAVFRRSFDEESVKLNDMGVLLNEFLASQADHDEKVPLSQLFKMQGNVFKTPLQLFKVYPKVNVDLYGQQPLFSWVNKRGFFDYSLLSNPARNIIKKCRETINRVYQEYNAELLSRTSFIRKQSRKLLSLPSIPEEDEAPVRDWPICMAQLHLTLRRPYLGRFGIWSPSWGICEARALVNLLISALENLIFQGDERLVGDVEEQRALVAFIRKACELRRVYDEPRFYDVWFGAMPLSQVLYRLHYTDTLKTHLRLYQASPVSVSFFKHHQPQTIQLTRWEYHILQLLLTESRTVATTKDIHTRWCELNDYYSKNFNATSVEDKYRNHTERQDQGYQIFSSVIARCPRLGFEKALSSATSPRNVAFVNVFKGPQSKFGDEYDALYEGKMLPDEDPRDLVYLKKIESLIEKISMGLEKVDEFEANHPLEFTHLNEALKNWKLNLESLSINLELAKLEFEGDEDAAPDFLKLEVALLDKIWKMLMFLYPHDTNMMVFRMRHYKKRMYEKLEKLRSCVSVYKSLVAPGDFITDNAWFASAEDMFEFLKVPGDTNSFRKITSEQRRSFNAVIRKRIDILMSTMFSKLPEEEPFYNLMRVIDDNAYCGFFMTVYSVCPRSGGDYGVQKMTEKLKEILETVLQYSPRYSAWNQCLRVMNAYKNTTDQWLKDSRVRELRMIFARDMYQYQRRTEIAEGAVVVDSLNTFCFDYELGVTVEELFRCARDDPGPENKNYWKAFTAVMQQIQQIPQIIQNCLSLTSFAPLEDYQGETRILRMIAQVAWLGTLNDAEATSSIRAYVRCFRKLHRLLKPTYPNSDNHFEFDFVKFHTPAHLNDARLLHLYWDQKSAIPEPSLSLRKTYLSRLETLIADFKKAQRVFLEADVPIPPMRLINQLIDSREDLGKKGVSYSSKVADHGEEDLIRGIDTPDFLQVYDQNVDVSVQTKQQPESQTVSSSALFKFDTATLQGNIPSARKVALDNWFLPWWRPEASDAKLRNAKSALPPKWTDYTGDDWTSDLIEYARIRLRPFTLLCLREVNDVLFQLSSEHIARLVDLKNSIAIPAVAQFGKGKHSINELPPLDLKDVNPLLNVSEFLKTKALSKQNSGAITPALPTADVPSSLVQVESQSSSTATWNVVCRAQAETHLATITAGPPLVNSKRVEKFNLSHINSHGMDNIVAQQDLAHAKAVNAAKAMITNASLRQNEEFGNKNSNGIQLNDDSNQRKPSSPIPLIVPQILQPDEAFIHDDDSFSPPQ
eukprot:GDKJ01009167.1.p1 GENE.GDKJ01009167.1~~GDKJ01009167.1.p1  ORF type:complete len:1768 (-),score=367.30 GDKJ01009167.1:289-5502(-)